MTIANNMTVYKNKEMKRPKITIDQDFSSGSAYESRLEMNLHTGTHLDMPLHFIEGGNTVDNLDISKVITKCKVFDMTHVEDKITKTDLENKEINIGDFIILKTKNSLKEEFDFKFVYLESSGAEFLKDKGIKGVGTDALGIERDQEGHRTHRTLLESEVVIIEGLRLKEVPEGEYLLFAAPLKIEGVEASPIRAILLCDTGDGSACATLGTVLPVAQ
jgi:arylformamidase